MCGIVGGVAQRDIAEILIEGLRRLEYRGYDSAGLSVTNKNTLNTRIRRVGKVQALADAVLTEAAAVPRRCVVEAHALRPRRVQRLARLPVGEVPERAVQRLDLAAPKRKRRAAERYRGDLHGRAPEPAQLHSGKGCSASVGHENNAPHAEVF